ncbi:MAG: integration host factor subunit alpha [Burkholderiales bacterium]|jgi:integration host factor subunit alpha|nr:integration host factor subunit alpha [Burkholderiales bacterium]
MSETFSRNELTELLFDQLGLNKREAKDLIEGFFEEITEALARGESVKLTGFGRFVSRQKKERIGRNPKTGVDTMISARRVVTFHASPKLKESVEHNNAHAAERKAS